MALFDVKPAAAGSPTRMGRLKVVFSVIPILLTVGLPSAKAVPLFCSDVVHYAERLLTGCGPDSNPSLTGMGAYLPREASTGASHEIDALLSRARPNPLVQVGPNVLADEPLAAKATDEIRHDREALKGISGLADENAEKSFQSTITKDENWYYMNVDRDGTYLFFGDPERFDQLDQLGEWPASETPDDGLPKGVGIGKRWRF
jgi:hypothetical protein